MAGKTKKSKSQEAYSARYKASKTWEANRKRRLMRTKKEQPNNTQLDAAMQGMVYRRKTPNTQVWSSSWIAIAKLFKQFGGRFDRDLMSANPDVVKAALAKPSPYATILAAQKKKVVEPLKEKDFFTIASRANMRAR